jgi:hypothetical protein
MGEKQNEPFQLSFNASVKVDFQESRVTPDGGLILVRELDERLRLGDLIAEHLSDQRRGKNTQLPLADLFRQSVYSRMAGCEDVNDAERLAQDPAFRLISSEKVWDRGVALTSRSQTFETEMLAEEENFVGLARINREPIGRAEALDSAQRVVLDMHSTGISVYGEQENSAYNSHFQPTCYHPLLLFNREGDCLAAKLRPGNVQLPVPGGELEDGAAGGGQSGVSLWGTVPPRGIHRDQPGDGQPRRGAVLQQARHGRAMDQGTQAGGEDDAAELPPVPVQRGALVAERDGLQLGQPLATSAASADRQMVADEFTAEAGEDRRPVGEARAVLLVTVGGSGPTRRLFGAMVRRIAALPVATG